MPNWCSNELIVTGPVKDVEKFVDDVKYENGDYKVLLSFNKLVPEPEELKHVDPRLLSDGSHDWRIKNWGTKWDLSDGDVNFSSHGFNELDHLQANYAFMTAWSPCTYWLKQVALMYPTLEFDLEYAEDGMYFQGRLIISKGEITEEHNEDYDPKRWGDDEDNENEEEELD